MFEFDAGKLILIGIVALVVIGPKELPRVMRQVGQALAKIRRLGAEFQAQFMEAMREADLEEVKAQAAKISESVKLDAGTDPLAGIRAELTKSLEERVDSKAEPASAAPATHIDETHADPLAEPLPEVHETHQAAGEQHDAPAAALPAEPALPLAAEPAPEPAGIPEPLHKRA